MTRKVLILIAGAIALSLRHPELIFWSCDKGPRSERTEA